MLYESNFLVHYGIKEMRWGIRRFQNKDGSLTPEGRKRYKKALDGWMNRSVQKVGEKKTNHYKPIKKQEIDLDEVKNRGKLNNREADQCIKLATAMYDEAKNVEPAITKDVVKTVSDSGCYMCGLENRLKQPTSLAAKIGSDAKNDDVSFKEAAGSIRDVVRYTSILPDDQFVSKYNDIKTNLENQGYREVRCRNYFELYREGKVSHKSVQCVFQNDEGYNFEIQFHTASSQAVKDMKLPLYKEVRSENTSPERRAEIIAQMNEFAELIPDPKSVEKIRSHG